MISINEFNARELDIFTRMSEPQLLHIYEPELGIFIAESPNVISRALDNGYEAISLLVDSKQMDNDTKCLLSRIGEANVYTASGDILSKITGFKLTRGLLCALRRKTMSSVEDICRNARNIAILEGVTNPTNVGAIFRSAAALNIDAIILSPDCSDPLYRRASRVSMGTVFQIPWTYFSQDIDIWYEEGIEKIKKMGFTTMAMALTDTSIAINSPILSGYDKKAIVLGSEGYGLVESTLSHCDHTVIIPMSHNVDSLNVAAASAVAFWELCN